MINTGISRKMMNENKRKQIEAQLMQLFTQSDRKPKEKTISGRTSPTVTVIRRRKGKSDLRVA
jgi:hypothetical protein